MDKLPPLDGNDELPEQNQLQSVMLAAGVPDALIDQVLELTKKYGPEILTAVVGMIGISRSKGGSRRYDDVKPEMTHEQRNEVLRDASGQIMEGTLALTAIAFASGNALYAIPEIAACLTALRPYLDSRFPRIASISEKVHADVVLAVGAAATGVATVSMYANSWWDALPPAGISAISAAFALGGEKAKALFRSLTISGGSAMVLGSGHSMIEALQKNDGVGATMSAVFLLLNIAFTKSEVEVALGKSKPLQP